jgi:hypothetical protein
MTNFDKKLFSYHGGYLNYEGTFDGQKTFDQAFETCHPSRVGQPVPLFVARFKYRGPITKAKFVAQLVKSFTVEEYAAELENGNTPVGALADRDPEWFAAVMAK